MFPAVAKPAPKFKRQNARPRTDHRGITGKSLLENIRWRLEHYWLADSPKAILVIDDADCQNPKTLDEQLSSVVKDFTEQYVGLWALPEIEVWFLADPKSTFKKHPKFKDKYQDFFRIWNQWLKEKGFSYKNLEKLNEFLIKEDQSGCEQKLSGIMEELFNTIEISYKKAEDSADLLRMLDPFEVEKRCPLFRERFRKLISIFGESKPC